MVFDHSAWTELPYMSTRRYMAAGVSVNDHQFLVTGGQNAASSRCKRDALESCEYYDINTDTWNNLAINLPRLLMGHGLVYVGDKLFVFGGQSGTLKSNCSALSDVFALRVPGGDLSNLQAGQHRWEALEPMPLARSKFAIVADDRYVYVIGGTDEGSEDATLRQWKTGHRYDIQRDSWDSLPDIPANEESHQVGVGHNCAAGMIENKIFVVGGTSSSTSRDHRETHIYDVVEQSWSSWKESRELPNGISNHCVLTCWNKFLITLGGKVPYKAKEFGQTVWCADAARANRLGWQESVKQCKSREGAVAGILSKDNCKFAIFAGGCSTAWHGREAETMRLVNLRAPNDTTWPLRYGNSIVPRACVDNCCNYYTIQNLPFKQNLTIKSVEFFAKRANAIQLIIYRRNGDAFSIVGKSHMIQAKLGENIVPVEPISAMSGDLMGWYVPSNGVVPFDLDLGKYLCPIADDRSALFTPECASSVTFKYSSHRTYSIAVKGKKPIEPTAMIIISDIFCDGVENSTEGDEYIAISNAGTASGDISGYRIKAGDEGPDFVFPEKTILSPGATYRVYTNLTDLSTGGFSFASEQAVWNACNSGVLFDSNGEQVDEFMGITHSTEVP